MALVLNSGSSSIKFDVFSLSTAQRRVKAESLLGGQVERIGTGSDPQVCFFEKDGSPKCVADPSATDHSSALKAIAKLLDEKKLLGRVEVVGHRVVHGGSEFSKPAIIDEETLAAIERCAPLAPLHNPPALSGVQSARERFPDCPHVAVFDTAFHASMPAESYNYALPKEVRDKGVRKYGFHGTSYAYTVSKIKEKYPTLKNLIIAHLGNGASMACIAGEQGCIDTTMGFTPLEGLVMGTRCGDLDAGVSAYLQRQFDYSFNEVDTLLNKQSGLLGLSGVSSDMRQVKEAALKGDEGAILARKVYVERIRKYLGAYIVKLQGSVDAIVFTAGVGEHDAELREAVCSNLENLGIAVDPLLNADANEGVCDVSAKFAKTKVIVSKTNEEEAIALQAAEATGLFREDLKQEARAQKEEFLTSTSVSQETISATKTTFAPFKSRGLYVDGVGPTAAEEVGLLYQLMPHNLKVGYFRPFANENDQKLATIRDLFNLDAHPLEAMRGTTVHDARMMLAEGREEELLDTVVGKYVDYAADKDFVLVSRGHLGTPGDAFWTAKVAAALNVPVVYVVHDHDKSFKDHTPELTPKNVSSSLLDADFNVFCERLSEIAARVKEAVDNRGGRFAGMIATIPSLEDREAVAEMLLDKIGVNPLALFPHDERFFNISMEEIIASLSAKVLLGAPETFASTYVKGVVVATMQANETVELLSQMPAGQLIVTHTARTDLLLAIAMAQQSPGFPAVAGICFSGADGSSTSITEKIPSDLVKTLTLLKRVPRALHLPAVIAVDSLTYEAANAIHEMTPVLLPSSRDKIEASEVLFERHLDPSFRRALVDAATRTRQETSSSSGDLKDDKKQKTTTSSSSDEKKQSERESSSLAVFTPKLFQHRLFSKARFDRQTIVLPEGNDRRVVAAAAELAERGLANIVLLGDPELVRSVANEARVEKSIFPESEKDLDASAPRRVRVADPKAESRTRQKMVEALVQARKQKGMTPESALALLRDDPNYYGTMLLELGLADGMVSGACHSTAATMRPPLQIIRMKPGFQIVSSIFFMLLSDGVKLFGDCAINVSPSADELAQIAAASAETARAFGIEPRVAMLSYATGDSNAGELIDKVRDATAKARSMLPNELFEGPIQFDAAVDPAVAKVKYHGKTSQVAGLANTLIFPSLDAGNASYKAVQQASKCVAIGPIMQGLRLPVNDLSRGCTVGDIVNTVVVTAIQAQAGKLEKKREEGDKN